MRLGLGTIIEPENRLDRADQLSGQLDAAFADAIDVAVQGLLRQGDAKGLLHRSHRSGELDGAPLRLWCVLFDGEPKLLGEGAHQFDRRRIGGMLLAVLGAGEAIFAQALGIERALAPDDDRNGDDAAGACRLFCRLPRKEAAFSLPADNALLGRKARGGCLGGMGSSPNRRFAHP